MVFPCSKSVCTLVLATSVAVVAAAEPPSARSPSQVVLLRNGSYLEGTVRREDGGCRVFFRGGGEILVPNEQIDLIARDLEHGYQLKRAALDGGLAPEHIGLAEWCLRHQLLPHAARHILQAISLDPEHPKIADLEHRLRLVAEQTALAAKRKDSKDVAKKQIPENSGKPSAASTRTDLHPQALERFAATVQPVLLNRCSSAGCHGRTSESEFRLLRPSQGVRISRNATIRNMHAALDMLDRDFPRKSPLLTAPAGPHGPLQHGLFAPHERVQLDRLAQWADLVASGRNAGNATAIKSHNQQLLQRLPSDPFPGQYVPPGPRLGSPPPSVNRQESATVEGDTGTDPFDPAMFNRQQNRTRPGGDYSDSSPR